MKLLFAILFVAAMTLLGKLGYWVAENVGLWPFPILLVAILFYEWRRDVRIARQQFENQADPPPAHSASQESCTEAQ
jgi:hypothetical protein